MKTPHAHSWIVAFLSLSFSFLMVSEKTGPVADRYDDDDAVERFMTVSSDSVLTVLNGNLWMLPGLLAVEKEERFEQFVSYAHRLMPHVITLQEIWTKNQITYLKRRFPEYRVIASGSGPLFNEAGLVTLTRIPSDSVVFSAFDTGRGASLIEKRARKGYLAVWLETPAFKACLINTHLYSPVPGNRQEHALVAEQFETLKRRRWGGDYFVVGDFNLAQSAFDRLNASYFLTEEDTSHTVEPGNAYRSLGVNRSRKKKSLKSDRMLMPRALARRFSLHAMLIREPVVSDHYLLAYRVELRDASLDPLPRSARALATPGG